MPHDASAPEAPAPDVADAGGDVGLEAPERVEALDVPRVLASAKAEDGLGMFVDLFGSDSGEGVEVTYHLRSVETGEEARVRCAVPYDGEVLSVWEIFPAALYPERELAEMFGVRLSGHPNPKRLLTTDEIGCFPLRRDVPLRAHGELARPGIRREAGDTDA